MAFGIEKTDQKSQTNAESFIDPTQQPHLQNIYNQAQQLGEQGMPVEGTAGLNPNLVTAMNNQTAAGTTIAGAGTDMMGAGSRLAGGSDQALNYATGAMGGNINPALNAGAQFANMGQTGSVAQGSGVNMPMANQMAGSASTAGPATISGPNFGIAQGAGGLAAQAGTTTNQGLNPNNLSKYMNNDVLSGQIGAVGRDITRNLTEQVKPTIAANAAATGNSGSSRRAVQDAIAERGAADRMADVSAQMRGSAYNAGLGFEAQRASQNAQLGQAGRQFDASARNQLTGQGLGIAGNQSMRQAELQQQASMGNRDAMNALRSQGFSIGSNQLESNLGRQQQGSQFSAEQYNRMLDSGMSSGLQNQQFGAQTANTIGQQGYGNMQSGADMLRGGIGDQRDAGEFQRSYDQALLNEEYRGDMAGIQGLQFYKDMVGPPTELNKSDSTSTKKGRGFSL
jgi:hypothetical protein